MSYDIQKFVELVRDKRFLYDMKDEEYKNRQKKALAWTEIAEEMGRENSNYWSSKWKMLKDNYSKFKKNKQTSTCPSYKKYRNWPWAELMRFLDDDEVLYQRTPSSNINLLNSNTTQNSHSASPSSDLEEVEHNPRPDSPNTIFEEDGRIHDSGSQNYESSRASTYGPIRNERRQMRRRIIGSEIQAVLDYIKSKNETRQIINSFDEVDLFFLSYAKNCKRLSSRSQAQLKMDIAALFTRYELQNEN